MVTQAEVDRIRREFLGASRDDRDGMLRDAGATLAEALEDLYGEGDHEEALGKVGSVALTLMAWSGLPAKEFPEGATTTASG